MKKSNRFNSTLPQLTAVLALSLGVFAADSFAGSAADKLAVSASITANCTIDASKPLAFGAYDPIGANKTAKLDGSGTISVTCTKGSAVTIELDGGLNQNGGGADNPNREMASGANRLAYYLYSDAGHTAIWAGGAGSDVDDTGIGTAQEHTVYGQVTEGQNVGVGSYTDVVIATVTF